MHGTRCLSASLLFGSVTLTFITELVLVEFSHSGSSVSSCSVESRQAVKQLTQTFMTRLCDVTWITQQTKTRTEDEVTNSAAQFTNDSTHHIAISVLRCLVETFYVGMTGRRPISCSARARIAPAKGNAAATHRKCPWRADVSAQSCPVVDTVVDMLVIIGHRRYR